MRVIRFSRLIILSALIILLVFGSPALAGGEMLNATDDTLQEIAPAEREDMIEALRLSLQYLQPVQDLNLVYYPPAAQMRILADDLEAQERALKFIRGVYERATKN